MTYIPSRRGSGRCVARTREPPRAPEPTEQQDGPHAPDGRQRLVFDLRKVNRTAGAARSQQGVCPASQEIRRDRPRVGVLDRQPQSQTPQREPDYPQGLPDFRRPA